MSFEQIKKKVDDYYTQKIRTYGPTAKGVDWKSPESQLLRFEQLAKLIEEREGFSVIDFGCGYGALADFLMERKKDFRYLGYDISKEMVSIARKIHSSKKHLRFTTDFSLLKKSDYVIASGIFNVKLDNDDRAWQEYIIQTLGEMASLAKKGFAFNVLTSYSDPEYRRRDLHYADPLMLFDHCKKKFSRFVALLHDYPLYEFTILVRYLEELSG